MNIRTQPALTFDDVLLVPKRSSIRSRSSVDPSSWLVPGIRLAAPIISANMDTVTEAPMAIAMAQAGGIGILHRFLPAERQAEAVRKVKRAESFVVENPIAIHPDATLRDARARMGEADIGGLVVVDQEGHLLGLLTRRDVLLAPDSSELVKTLMTHQTLKTSLHRLSCPRLQRPYSGLIKYTISSSRSVGWHPPKADSELRF